MTAIGPLDYELLDFLCACVHHRVRVKAIKAKRRASLKRLRLLGMVSWEGYQPSGSAFDNWRARQQTRSEGGAPEPTPEEPPAPKAAEARGGGDARKLMPPPNRGPSGSDLAAELDAFVEAHGLAKSAVAMRLFKNTNGVEVLRLVRVPRPVTIAKVRAFLAADPPAELKRHQGVGPARATKPEAPLGDRRFAANRRQASPIPSAGYADPVDPPASPTVESVVVPDISPEPRPALEQSPPTVDIKVNAPARRDPTQPPSLPLTELRDRQISRGFAHAAAVRRGHEKTAADLLDAGVDPSSQSSVVANKMREVERRRVEEARLLDPIEQAKTIIRQGGWNCFGAIIAGGPAGMFYIGNKLQTEAELLAFAERLRTTRRRRA